MKRLIVCLMAMMGVLTLSAQSSIYDFTVKDDTGKDVSLAEYKGKVLLKMELHQVPRQSRWSCVETL